MPVHGRSSGDIAIRREATPSAGSRRGAATASPTRHLLTLAAVAIATLHLPAAHAQNAPNLDAALAATNVHGMVGLMNFDYLNHPDAGDHHRYDTHAFGVGGHIVVHTGSFHGFSVGLGGYTGQSLGLYDRNPTGYSDELAGRHYGIQSIREAYLQYQSAAVEIRAGRQLIDTPWINEDFYTFNPRAFMGVAGVADLIGHGPARVSSSALSLAASPATLSVFAARMFTYESRYSSGFTAGNRYAARPANGFLTLGIRYQGEIRGAHLRAQAWYYDFYQYARMFYGEAEIEQPVGRHTTLVAAAQMVAEGNSPGHAVFAFTNGHAATVDSHVYGGKLGLSFGAATIALVGDYNPVAYNSFRHGGMVHPYNDLTGTNFTDTLNTGISDIGPGYAYGLTASFILDHKKLKLTADYLRYLARYGYGGDVYAFDGTAGFPTGADVPNERMTALNFVISYRLSSILKGLSIAYHPDIVLVDNRPGYPQYRNPFFNSRFYLRYKF